MNMDMMERKVFTYKIQYTKAADKFFKAHGDIKELYESSIKELFIGNHPEQIDIKRIRGKRNDYYQMKIGNYRVIYAIIKGIIVVIDTIVAGPRGDVYKKIGGLK